MSAHIELRTTPGRGEGVFTLKAFEPGEILLVGVLETADIANHSHASQIGKNEFGFHGGLSPKFNHSCNPNCGIRLNASGGHNLVAMRSISVDEEATYDYAMRNYKIEHFPASCSCSQKTCRSSITGWKDLPQARKDAYQDFTAPYLIEIDHENLISQKATHKLERDSRLSTCQQKR